MITTSITIDFLRRLRVLPSWREMEFAFENQLVPIRTLIDYANERIAKDGVANQDEIAIAEASLGDSIAEAVRRLANHDDNSTEKDVRSYWARILLAWVYENRASLDDVLGVVEEIYADFDYPEELIPFVRYMPSEAPDLGSREANEERMVASIGSYVRSIIDCGGSKGE